MKKYKLADFRNNAIKFGSHSLILNLNRSVDMHPDESHTFLITTPEDVGIVGSIKIEWVRTVFGMPTLNTRNKILLDFVKIVPMNTQDKM